MAGNKELIGAAKLSFAKEFFIRNFEKDSTAQSIDFQLLY
jgi:hypothetical protein